MSNQTETNPQLKLTHLLVKNIYLSQFPSTFLRFFFAFITDLRATLILNGHLKHLSIKWHAKRVTFHAYILLQKSHLYKFRSPCCLKTLTTTRFKSSLRPIFGQILLYLWLLDWLEHSLNFLFWTIPAKFKMLWYYNITWIPTDRTSVSSKTKSVTMTSDFET